MTATVVIGLDLSLTASGLARLTFGQDWQGKEGWLADTWTRPSAPRPRETLSDRHHRVVHICADILGFTVPCDLVVIEGQSYGSTGGKATDRAYLWWRVVGRLLDHEVPVVVVPPATVKKWAAASGRADKAAVAAAVGRLWPDVEIRNENEGDALALASIGAQLLELNVPFSTPQYRRDAVAKLQLPEEEAA
jgi:Holliday junction resolvasome RuvABC endonuclease subunit